MDPDDPDVENYLDHIQTLAITSLIQMIQMIQMFFPNFLKKFDYSVKKWSKSPKKITPQS
ncbi:MAG: hypothetical protein PUP90_31430 [Nostoc sp. S4]|nr:hypothetical protein [Nostoc sp. S4]